MIQSERLTSLSEILIELFRSPVPTHFFQTLGDRTGSVLPHDFLAVCLSDTEKGHYLVHTLVGLDPGAVRRRGFSLDEGLPGRAITTGQAQRIEDVTLVRDGVHDLEGVLSVVGLRATMAAPIRRGLDVLGACCSPHARRSSMTTTTSGSPTLLASGLSAALETSQAYQTLADEHMTMLGVLGSTADAVIATNQGGLVLLANRAVHQMLGLGPGALEGRPLFEVVDYGPLRELFLTGQPGLSELPLPDGRIAQASMVEVVTPFGEPVGLAVILRDITLLKNLEQMKNDFVNTVSHDLKSPITVIAGLADLLRMAGPTNPAFEKQCQDIRDTAQHMAELVTDLLDIGKIEAGLDAAREPMDLVPIAEEALQVVRPNAERKTIELRADLPGEAIVLAAPIRIKQALVNLIDNGIKYTPSGGQVTMSAVFSAGGDGAETVMIRVSDTGLGIPARDLPHVFDKFYRVKSEATREIAGTGLGRAITKTIVESVGGRIRVESNEGMARRSRSSCRWPAADASASSAEVGCDERPARPLRAEAPEGERRRIDWCLRAGDQRRHHLADDGRELEAMSAHAGRDPEAAQRRLVEDRHPVRRDVERPGPAAAVARLGQTRDRAGGALENLSGFVEPDVGSEQLGFHRMLLLVVRERAGESEPTRLRPRVAAAREVEIDQVRAPE
jgi:signal transduction histidine kinase